MMPAMTNKLAIRKYLDLMTLLSSVKRIYEKRTMKRVLIRLTIPTMLAFVM